MFDFQCREHGFGEMCFDTHPRQRPSCNESHSSFTQQNRRTTAQDGVDLACEAAKISSNIGTYPLSTYAARPTPRGCVASLSIPFPLYIMLCCWICIAGWDMHRIFHPHDWSVYWCCSSFGSVLSSLMLL
jgi:hypothetical protein